MQEYLQKAEDVFASVKSSAQGLTAAEAQKRLAEHGENKLQEGKKKSLIRRLLEQFTDPMIIILIVAAVISAVTSIV